MPINLLSTTVGYNGYTGAFSTYHALSFTRNGFACGSWAFVSLSATDTIQEPPNQPNDNVGNVAASLVWVVNPYVAGLNGFPLSLSVLLAGVPTPTTAFYFFQNYAYFGITCNSNPNYQTNTIV